MGLSNVTLATVDRRDDSDALSLPASYHELHWYALHTCANHEKKVAAEIKTRDVEYFLPVFSSVRRWKDRRVSLELPLFPGYVFVRLALRDRLRVLQISSVVRLVGFNNQPAALPDEEMETLRAGVARHLRAEPHPFLTSGRRVRITSGPFVGLEGIMKRRNGNLRIVVSLDLIQRSIAVDVEAENVAPVESSSRLLHRERRESATCKSGI